MNVRTAWGAALIGYLALITGGLLAPAAHAAAPGDLLWARSAGGSSFDEGRGIAVDAAGNVLVMGSFMDSATFGAGEDNETTLTAAGYWDVFIAQYAPDGTLRWARSAGGSDYDRGFGIAVDAAGNALVTGRFTYSATFGAGEANETTLTAAGAGDVFIAQYAPDGTLRWARSAGGSSYDYGFGIAVDATGNALVTGYFRDSATFGAGEANETTLTTAGVSDIFIAQYAPDGTLRWARSAGGYTYDRGRGIAVDSTGNALVTGYFSASATFGAGAANETTLTAAGDYDIFIAQYAPDGTLLWARSAGGSGQDVGWGIAVDAADNVLVTDFFDDSATFGAGEANETTLTAAGDRDVFIAQYAPDGTLRWARSAGGSDYDRGVGIAVDAAGNAVVTGHFDDSATFGAGEANETTLTAAGDSDVFIAQYAPDGTLLWARSAGGSEVDGGNGIAVDAAGNALVSGIFTYSATFGAGEANETTLTAAGEYDVFFAEYAGAPSSEQSDLAIAKRADPLPARVSKDLTYTLTIVNQGPGDATEVVVLDWLPKKVRVVSLPDHCRLVHRKTVRCALGRLAAGAEIQLEIEVRPKKPGLLVNRARVKAEEADLNEADNAVTLRTRVRGCGSSCDHDDDHPGKHHDDDEDEDHQRH